MFLAKLIRSKSKRLPKSRRQKIGMKKFAKIALAIMSIVAAAYFVFYDQVADSFMPGHVRTGNALVLLPELITTGYSIASFDVAFDNNQGVVLLTSGCNRITAYVEKYEAESIYRGMNKLFVARPESHDIFVDTLEGFGIKVLMVKINEVKDNAFYGRLILRKGETIVSMEARPSDATAIAVRTGAPIYVKNQLFEQYGEKIC